MIDYFLQEQNRHK